MHFGGRLYIPICPLHTYSVNKARPASDVHFRLGTECLQMVLCELCCLDTAADHDIAEHMADFK